MSPQDENFIILGAAGVLGVFIFIVIIVGFNAILSGALTAERYNTTITVSDVTITSNHRINILSSDGEGFIEYDLNMDPPEKNRTYFITYYCNNNAQRIVEKIVPLSGANPYKCKDINGVCQ